MSIMMTSWMRDPDHAPARLNALIEQASVPARGAPLPGGFEGATADGAGGVRATSALRASALQRMRDAVGAMGEGMPALTADGSLPAGIHHVRWSDVVAKLSSGPRRTELTKQLAHATKGFRAAGIEQVVIGGSYVGNKGAPGDVDVAALPRRDGRPINWLRLKSVLAARAPDVHAYKAEAIVSDAPKLRGTRAGESFLELFQHDRAGIARGAILLDVVPARGLGAALGDALRGLAALR